jgi:hypothetical protein
MYALILRQFRRRKRSSSPIGEITMENLVSTYRKHPSVKANTIEVLTGYSEP